MSAHSDSNCACVSHAMNTHQSCPTRSLPAQRYVLCGATAGNSERLPGGNSGRRVRPAVHLVVEHVGAQQSTSHLRSPRSRCRSPCPSSSPGAAPHEREAAHPAAHDVHVGEAPAGGRLAGQPGGERETRLRCGRRSEAAIAFPVARSGRSRTCSCRRAAG